MNYPTKRQIEIDRLKSAIRNTSVAKQRARETVYKLSDKHERQQSELLLQTLLARFDKVK